MPIPQFTKKLQSVQSWRNNEGRLDLSRQNPDKKPRKMKYFLYFMAFMAVSGIVSLIIMLIFILKDLPDPNRLIEREIAQSTRIYDRTGEHVLYEIFGNEKRTLVNLQEIPDTVKNATVAVEDKNFYNHKGFSLWAIARTVITNIIYSRKAGGSTLTQQFVKNAVLTSEKTYTRKLKELILAYRLEKKFTKDEILQMYLNEIPYGSTAYGVEAASQRYFGKSVKEINLAESAILAAIPQAPSRYSPFGLNRDMLIDRQKYILDLMAEQNYITKDEAESAKSMELIFKEQSNNITAPHFVMYVKELLSEKYGEKTVEQGGLKIITTLDLYKQEIAEKVVKDKAEKNKDKFNAWNASLISIDPKTGQVLTMVGSKDYFGKSEPENCVSGKDCKFEPNDNVALRPRQPGSSIKPLVYATAFIKGFTPNTILFDVNTNFSNDPDKPYEPRNYDLGQRGPVSMRKALAGSLNIPAVKTLYLAGIDNVLDLASNLGYTTLNDKNRFGLSLVLGGGEVTLAEHTTAFSVFAREGVKYEMSAILKVEDGKGNILEEYKENNKRIFEAEPARQLNDVLSDNNARSYVFGSNNWLTLGNRPVAAKTGTTNDYRDAWTIGYTPSLVAGVWVGNNDNSPMKKGSDGSVVAAPIWHEYMKQVLGDTPFEEFKKPEKKLTGKAILDGAGFNETKVKIDKSSGLLATENTPPELIEEKIYKDYHCILYYIDKNNPKGDAPKNPESDPQFLLWEKAVKTWADAQGLASSTPPTESDNIHTSENKPTLSITNITNNQEITDQFLTINIEASANRGISSVKYYFDNQLSTENNQEPFNFNKNISFLTNGFHVLKVVACDDVKNCTEKELSINIKLSDRPANSQTAIEWQYPHNGLAVNSIDFPLSIKFHLSNPEYVHKLQIFCVNSQSKERIDIGEIDPQKNSEINYTWLNPPKSGTYSLYVEAFKWGENSVVSKPTVLSVSSFD